MWLEDTPQYDPCRYETQNAQTFPLLQRELDSTPEVAGQYTDENFLFSRGDQMAIGHVTSQRQDSE